jgi:gamma-glutamyltranspeptidase/glutathione hydrolase
MKRRLLKLGYLCIWLFVLAGTTLFASPTRGMVASGHPIASEVGLQVLKAGGNAIDAAVATGFALGVVDGHNSGIGGGCFMLIRLANGKIAAIDGRETAPARAHRDMFIRDGKADTALSQNGALASGVPGEVAAFDYAVRHYGRRSWKSLIEPSISVANAGYAISEIQANRLQAVADVMGKFEASRQVFFREGKPLRTGDLLRQPELAGTYRHIAEEGAAWFYQGDFAKATEKWMQENGGLLTQSDFAKYQVILREPVETKYRGFRVVSFPPPSSGGVHVIQMLNMLEGFNLKQMDEGTRWHVLAESMKLAFADRAYWLGDPDFARVPRGLISKRYARGLARQIQVDHAGVVQGHGTPPDWENALVEKHTTHFSVADAEGNWVACTATINTSFGSKVVIPGTGVVMNNQMDDFSAQPGVANAFGLVGAEANAVAPGKRPLSSMSPTLVFKGKKPILALGAAGGPKIISTVLSELVLMLDLGFTPQQAVSNPRIHHQWSPNTLVVEDTLPQPVRDDLKKRGHQIEVKNAISTSQIIGLSKDGKSFSGGADPRVGGSAAGW